ncbi:ATP-dependent (S)-NAD(P)H-hydrate dehydratase-like [Epargyreus clarus]|uniref:ATP-dependent (S)-NAD(P)H-hydrate dehydratase-like n=1 Tax=Epargyreus clarus TaxID=520877 RepID=UPI003C303820
MNLLLYSTITLLIICESTVNNVQGLIPRECANLDSLHELMLNSLSRMVIPDLHFKRKGEAGKILVIGGSVEYTGAPYFAAISALKVGADLVHVITTEAAAPVIKSYSPDLIVHPIRNIYSLSKINILLPKMHVIVIGPGLGRENDDIKLVHEIVETCKVLRKPLVIDADGLYAIARNISVLKDYPSPGAILTPNHVETKRLMEAMPNADDDWFKFWGEYVSVLEKGAIDQYHSNLKNYSWALSEGGSGRRAGGQGDILAGSLATFYHWTLQSNLCENYISMKLAQSVATHAAAKLTRTCNFKAYQKLGRSMIASDMINEIHASFVELFE